MKTIKSSKMYRSLFSPIIKVKKENIISGYENIIEVKTNFYQYPGLEKNKDAIIVLGIISSSMIQEKVKSYQEVLFRISSILNMDIVKVNESVRLLENLKLVVAECDESDTPWFYRTLNCEDNTENSGLIEQGNSGHKNIMETINSINIYTRIFDYPMINIDMVHIYSCYLMLSKSLSNYEYCKVGYLDVAEILGYTEKQIINTVKGMEQIGLIKNEKHENKNVVNILVDFSRRQPEQDTFENYLKCSFECNDFYLTRCSAFPPHYNVGRPNHFIY